jgi:hypothetical protein
MVGVLAPEPAGDGWIKDGVELTEYGVTGEGLGERPISIDSPV